MAKNWLCIIFIHMYMTEFENPQNMMRFLVPRWEFKDSKKTRKRELDQESDEKNKKKKKKEKTPSTKKRKTFFFS